MMPVLNGDFHFSWNRDVTYKDYPMYGEEQESSMDVNMARLGAADSFIRRVRPELADTLMRASRGPLDVYYGDPAPIASEAPYPFIYIFSSRRVDR